MKSGLVLEGGAMRGMYTAGVLDVWMERGVTFDGAVGVSAGAVFGCNIKSRQIGRVIRYNKKYCRDKRYVSLRLLLTTGNIYGVDFCYREIPETLDPFDTEAYQDNPMEFYVTATDIQTGKPVYQRCDKGDAADIRWMLASSAMPLLFKPVEIDGRLYSDGGTADSLPLGFMEKQGYDRNVVVLTRPSDYRKKRSKSFPFIRLALRRYPALVQALYDRPARYNAAVAEIARREQAGEVFVIRPSAPIEVGAVERNPQRLETVYQLGRRDAENTLEALRAFLQK